MIGIRYMIKNNNNLKELRFEEFNNYETALKFYIENKYKLRETGVFIQLINIK